MLDRFTGGQPRPPGKWGKALSISSFLLAPVFVYLAYRANQPVLWDLVILCFVVGGMASALSRLWHRRRRLAYGLNAAGMLIFQAAMIVFLVSFGVRGEWGPFWYGVFVYGFITSLVATGVFHPDSVTRGDQRNERS